VSIVQNGKALNQIPVDDTFNNSVRIDFEKSKLIDGLSLQVFKLLFTVVDKISRRVEVVLDNLSLSVVARHSVAMMFCIVEPKTRFPKHSQLSDT
jgi:hypothetical protein